MTATLALVFAMSGGALAASHYVITSKKQISPTVLKSLKGKPGKAGAAGKTGATGPAGATGAAGPAGGSLAYAAVVINSAGNPAFIESSGFTSVTHPAANVYCLSPAIPGHPVLLSAAGTSTPIALGPSESCPGGYQVESGTNLASGQGFIAAVP
ncbi:MAG TPA: hypothetical protein VHZ54_09365 [Solirubrobacterales bacterium]|nr:hypothetical protein [Solirubrobacterales bacterium]